MRLFALTFAVTATLSGAVLANIHPTTELPFPSSKLGITPVINTNFAFLTPSQHTTKTDVSAAPVAKGLAAQ